MNDTPTTQELIAELREHDPHDGIFTEIRTHVLAFSADALQAQAQRIVKLEEELREQCRFNWLDECTLLRTQLDALRVEDELPEPEFWMYPQGEGFRMHFGKKAPEGMKMCESYYTADQLRQAQAMVRAKMVPLTDDAIAKLIVKHKLMDREWPTQQMLTAFAIEVNGITGETK